MGSARKKTGVGSARHTDSPVDRARSSYHSLHAQERETMIDLLVEEGSPESTRELLQLYQDCEWRATRLHVIQALARCADHRSLEFLFSLARDPSDLSVSEAAIRSIGQSQQRLAAHFLTGFYTEAPDSLRATVVSALGQIPDRTLANTFVQDLKEAVLQGQFALIKSLTLTLGELKVHEALPTLIELAKNSGDRTIALSALLSIGKISRDPHSLESLASCFKDPFESQLFKNAQTQVQFRSQWKLEDYLVRLFQTENIHRSLAFELNQFPANDVKAGLHLFDLPENFSKLCQALGKFSTPDIATWYSELFDFDSLSESQLIEVLGSISLQHDSALRPPLESLRSRAFADPAHPIFAAWLEAVALSLPEAAAVYSELIRSEAFRGLPEEARIQVINQLTQLGLTIRFNQRSEQHIGRTLEHVLESDPSPAVQTRALRAMGNLGHVNSKLIPFLKEKARDPQWTGSLLSYCEHCPDRATMDLLMSLLLTLQDDRKLRIQHLSGLFRALKKRSEPLASPGLLYLIQEALKENVSEPARLEAIRLLCKFPLPEVQPLVLSCLHGSLELQLAAIVCIKSYGIVRVSGSTTADTALADALAPFLVKAGPQSTSLVGRALDALTALPGLRAKRLVIDYLSANPTDLEVCDKIIRCLRAPESGSEYFTAIVDDILKKHPTHLLRDGLTGLKEKLSVTLESSSISTLRKSENISSMDQSLSEKIPGYASLAEVIKSVLRSAEMPYLKPELFDEYVDKSSSVLEYTKAVDIFLELELGKKQLFIKIENQLAEFQNVLYWAGLHEECPDATHLLQKLGVEKHFNPSDFPLHKMQTIAKSILSGRIVHEHFKMLDGLRAWAVILLLFARKPAGIREIRPLIHFREPSDEVIIPLVKRLIQLQDLRNPAAHRQTLSQFVDLDGVRSSVFHVLGTLKKLV